LLQSIVLASNSTIKTNEAECKNTKRDPGGVASFELQDAKTTPTKQDLHGHKTKDRGIF